MPGSTVSKSSKTKADLKTSLENTLLYFTAFSLETKTKTKTKTKQYRHTCQTCLYFYEINHQLLIFSFFFSLFWKKKERNNALFAHHYNLSNATVDIMEMFSIQNNIKSKKKKKNQNQVQSVCLLSIDSRQNRWSFSSLFKSPLAKIHF